MIEKEEECGTSKGEFKYTQDFGVETCIKETTFKT
jgi:hypothetical protein